MPDPIEAIYRRIPWADWPTCNPALLGKRLKKGVAATTSYHCKRLDCLICGPVIVAIRARNLLYALRKEQSTVWFGEIDKTALQSIQRYAFRHPQEKRLTSIYFDSPDLRTVLATVNMIPRRSLLSEMPIEEAVVNGWYRYAIDYRLRKNPHDDWDITSSKQWIDWVDEGPKDDMLKTDEHMDKVHGYVPGEVILDPERFTRRYRRYRSSLTNPPADGYLD